ncbi:hypothetical protein [Nocardiopsis tropica]|uniref:Uncharacterized protein n=1 Tax=Nocardiopsis tropica TaxID=109330 RepID=A0ABU7KMF8_9ACTN|nr:hypothetical protein [Nocardiopsis umidischolae]MEE2050475.1 hypothetical protein [Nocardiopsis umidischolae]
MFSDAQATVLGRLFLDSTGVGQPIAECRRCRSWRISGYSKIASASSDRVRVEFYRRIGTADLLPEHATLRALREEPGRSLPFASPKVPDRWVLHGTIGNQDALGRSRPGTVADR